VTASRIGGGELGVRVNELGARGLLFEDGDRLVDRRV
jgi:hypothetical protein